MHDVSQRAEQPGPRISLPRGEVHLWSVFSDRVSDGVVLGRFRAMMSPDERRRQGRFYFEKDQHQCLVTRGLVRSVLSRYAAVDPAAWVFATNNYGKPHVKEPASAAWLQFNLSHTAGMVVCAVSCEHDVGVDVENLARQVNPGLAGRYFAPSEVRALEALPEAERPRAFFDYWTLKESYIKARGMGLAIPLADFAFERDPTGAIGIAFAPRLEDDPARWQFRMLHPSPTHQVALAVCRPPGEQIRIVVQEAESLLR